MSSEPDREIDDDALANVAAGAEEDDPSDTSHWGAGAFPDYPGWQ